MVAVFGSADAGTNSELDANALLSFPNSAVVPQLPTKCEIANAFSDATDAPTLSQASVSVAVNHVGY